MIGVRCTRDVKSGIAIAKAAFKQEKDTFLPANWAEV
jgi:hypothetical protein